MLPTEERAALLNEVNKRMAHAKGGAAGFAASLGGTHMALAALSKDPQKACAAFAASAGRLGRPLFCKNGKKTDAGGMLGTLVKLNPVRLGWGWFGFDRGGG